MGMFKYAQKSSDYMAKANAADRLRGDLGRLDKECFDVLTFGELNVGDRFIAFPSPGDNSGHGGYLRGSYLFEKINGNDRTADGLGIVDNSKRVKDQELSHIPAGMWIYKIL